MSQSIPVSQQAPLDVGVSAQAAPAPGSAVTLSPPAGEVVWDALGYKSPCWNMLGNSHTLARSVFSALPSAEATQRCCR